MPKNPLVMPFLKWVGGKRQLQAEITALLPTGFSRLRYYEPFVGGGAIFFSQQPRHAVINDFNTELVNAYCVIRDNVEELIAHLSIHENNADYFYALRNIDRDRNAFQALNEIERASRVIYLNKTCYNGMYRVNNAGEFNVPFGGYRSPNIINEPVLRAVSRYLNSNDITILNGDYNAALQTADRHSFVYLDPPYYPISTSSSFTGYIQGGWDENEQIRLKETCDWLTANNVRFLLSNSDCNFIRDLYHDYEIHTVQAVRSINSNGNGRGAVNEVLVKNY